MKKLSIVLLSIWVVCSCGGSKEAIVNKNYNNTDPTLKAFILPLLGNDFEKANKILFSTLESTDVEVISLSSTFQLLQVNKRFTKTLIKAKTSVLNSEVKNFPNLYDSLDDYQVKTLQNNTGHADLFIFLHDIGSQTMTKVNNSGSISAIGKLSVFDLHTGQFVMQCRHETKESYDDMNQTHAIPIDKLIVGLLDCVVNELGLARVP